MSKILVTGANGYIGKYVVIKLLDKGYDVIAVDFNNEYIDKRAKFIKANVLDITEDIFKFYEKPDTVLHLAWQDGFNHFSRAHISSLSLHYNFLIKMMESGVKHIGVMGTMHEIGYHEGAVDENTPSNPLSLYGLAKNSLRKALELEVADKGVVFQWLRAFYIYGDDVKNHSIFAKIIQSEKEGKKEFPINSGKNKYDFIEVSDLAEQISSAITQNEVTGIINCCSGMPKSLGEMVEIFIKDNNLKIKLKYGAFPDRPYDSPAIWGDITKISKILNTK